MRRFIRILVALLALAGIIVWTICTAQIWQWGHSFTGFGSGDGGPASSGSGGEVFGVLLIAAIWFLPVSPYLCMAGGVLNLITGKWLRVAYVYTLVVLALLTLVELVPLQRRLELMALGNIVAGGLWGWLLRNARPIVSPDNPTTP
jgi:hypothetical protein